MGKEKGFVIFSNYIWFVLCIKHLVYVWPAVSMCTERTDTRRLKWIQDLRYSSWIILDGRLCCGRTNSNICYLNMPGCKPAHFLPRCKSAHFLHIYIKWLTTPRGLRTLCDKLIRLKKSHKLRLHLTIPCSIKNNRFIYCTFLPVNIATKTWLLIHCFY